MIAILVFLMNEAVLGALLTAAAVHELGHVLALVLCGARITQIRVEFTGLCLVCTALTHRRDEAFAALAGPAAGLLWSAIATSFWPLSASFSLLLSLYNLLPALPLDGGRFILAWTGRGALLRFTGALCATGLLALAVWAPLPLLLIPTFRLWLSALRA